MHAQRQSRLAHLKTWSQPTDTQYSTQHAATHQSSCHVGPEVISDWPPSAHLHRFLMEAIVVPEQVPAPYLLMSTHKLSRRAGKQ